MRPKPVRHSFTRSYAERSRYHIHGPKHTSRQRSSSDHHCHFGVQYWGNELCASDRPRNHSFRHAHECADARKRDSAVTATDSNDPANAGVTWSLVQDPAACSPSCGTVSPASTASGSATTYTAPASVPTNPTTALNAVSVEDTTKSASATITITAGTVKLVPASMSFGVVVVGRTSRVIVTTLSNTGSGNLNITSVTASPQFAQTNDCGTSVAAGASCTISVTFKPGSTGTKTGNSPSLTTVATARNR